MSNALRALRWEELLNGENKTEITPDIITLGQENFTKQIQVQDNLKVKNKENNDSKIKEALSWVREEV